MKHRAVTALIALSCVIFPVKSGAKDLGVFGAVYDIAEKDALKEIEERAGEVDVSWMINRDNLARRVRNYTPGDLKEVKLPPARKERTFLVDMTYTLDRDIGDEKGNVIYPKGYTFNPLDYVTYPGIIVIIDGKSRMQVAWFKSSGYAKDLKAKLFITDGSYAELSKALKRPVFYANRAVIEVFRVEVVPSVVKQSGSLMEVKEIPVREKDP